MATYETREAIMKCGCRIIMDATTYEAEGAHCAVHDETEVVRVIKVPPVEVPEPPPEGTRSGRSRSDERREERTDARRDPRKDARSDTRKDERDAARKEQG